MPEDSGKTLIIFGLGLAVLGGLILIGGRVGLGRLPGDVVIRGERSVFYLPVATCLLLSLGLSAILWILRRWRGD